MTDLNGCASFFERFARRAVSKRLTEFHESGGDCPVSVTWLDRTLAEQNLAIAFDDTANDNEGILVVHCPAVVTDRSLAIVVFGSLAANRTAAT